MSIFGYIAKHKKALWTQIHPPAPKPPHNVQRVKTKRKPILRPKTPQRGSAVAKRGIKSAYRVAARAAVEAARKAGLTCPVVNTIPELRDGMRYGHKISNKLNEIHHRFGRIGALLIWFPGWIVLSKQGHRWCHEHPVEAAARGWMGPTGTWNDFARAKAFMETAGVEWKNNLIPVDLPQ